MHQINHFGRAFALVRRARGLTQEDFAHVSGRTYIGELERGMKQPTLKKIDELAESLGLHPLTPLVIAYLEGYSADHLEALLNKVKSEVNAAILLK